jgi:hypothetical protein
MRHLTLVGLLTWESVVGSIIEIHEQANKQATCMLTSLAVDWSFVCGFDGVVGWVWAASPHIRSGLFDAKK